MGNFLSLVSVENTKLWKRLSTKIMLIILAGSLIGIFALLMVQEKTIQNSQTTVTVQSSADGTVIPQQPIGDWKQQLKVEDTGLQAQIDTAEKSSLQSAKSQIGNLKFMLAENNFRIDNNIKSDGTKDFWYYIITSGVFSIIALFAIIACSGLVAGEFSDGTMKTMISRPFSRWQILTAKLIPIVIYTIILTAVSFLAQMLGEVLFLGTKGFNGYQMLYIHGTVMYIPGFCAALITAGLTLATVIVYVILTFALSAIFRSRALATGLSIFLMLAGSFTIFLAMNFSWGKYILFCDTNFSSFVTSGAPFYGITLSFALIISAIYSVVFLAVAYFIFAKRDIC